MKRILTVIAVLLLTNVPISCVDDDCGGFTPQEGTIAELSAEVGTFTSSGFTPEKSTDFNQAAVLIAITNMNYTAVSETQADRSFSFINTAYACSPMEPKPTQAIESITITSEAPVYVQGRTYAAGESLNELFKIASYSSGAGETSIEAFIAAQKNSLTMFGYVGSSLIFQLKEQPDSPINQPFTFNFLFSDAARIAVETETVEIRN